ncbi:acetate--CoA ligase family protein [Desulfosporosinus sp. BICA1-9]|uniref:acetate--CoA ligase family protein n=1 Tax=Desulfosporosinus sp. BICA1-9 TaxID=1531958 RepID=UPI000B22A879|nr:acetate--CoA ligase [Desulfosporosinus sp. BICA1-9]
MAVVGAGSSPKKMGSRTLRLIKEFGFTGGLYAVNPRSESCCGVPGFQRVVDIPEEVDLCIIAVPAVIVPEVVADCAEKGVPVAQILTSGFGEAGTEGREAERKIIDLARGKTRIIGPNCMGVYSSAGRLTFITSADSTVGNISICSQSGGLSIEMVLQAKARGMSLGKLVSMGNCLDLDPVDFLNFLGQDSGTEVIGFYLEGLRRGREFLEALTRVAAVKPVVILKGGRTDLGAKSVASHTNSLAGQYDTWKAAVMQAGAIAVEGIDDFLAMLTALQGFVPRPSGKGLALVGNGGGATVLATDLLAERGLTLATLDGRTKAAIMEIEMPAGSSVGNPTDTPASALHKKGGEALGTVINRLLEDPAVGGAIVHFNLLPFINYDNPGTMAEGISATLLSVDGTQKPVYVGLRAVPDQAVESLRLEILDAAREAQLPCFHSAYEAVSTMAGVYKWSQRPLPVLGSKFSGVSSQSVDEARNIITRLQEKGVKYLSQESAFCLLDLFGIPHPELRMARSPEEAAHAAAEIGFPVVMKIDSPDIVHKTEAGGVRVGLKSAAEVVEAFEGICASARQYKPDAFINGILIQGMSSGSVQEMICGLKRDPVFGGVLVLGIGGVLVEVLKDASMRVLPLAKGEEGLMWRELAGSTLLTGYRGRPVADLAALEDLIERVAEMGQNLPEIAEMDLNPVMVMKDGSGVSVVDCRIIIS